MYEAESASDKLSFWVTFPIQAAVFFGSILLVEIGTRVHERWKRQLDDDVPTY